MIVGLSCIAAAVLVAIFNAAIQRRVLTDVKIWELAARANAMRGPRRWAWLLLVGPVTGLARELSVVLLGASLSVLVAFAALFRFLRNLGAADGVEVSRTARRKMVAAALLEMSPILLVVVGLVVVKVFR